MSTRTRTFRVFVSSTFADLKAERAALAVRVFPRLRELCQQHGARFQAVDLRWGVSSEASLDQKTMLICLEELRRSQRISPRPNFVVLLGDRYGWRPLPYAIPGDEFAEIERRCPERYLALLREWPLLGPQIATPARLWLCAPGVTGGRWADVLTATCDACGQRFPVPAAILGTIAAIARNTGLSPQVNPFPVGGAARLPAEAWDDPRLLSECPLCGEPLKFNPFVVDNRDRYS